MGENNNHKQLQNTIAGGHRIPKERHHASPSKQNIEEQPKDKTPAICESNKIHVFQQQPHKD